MRCPFAAMVDHSARCTRWLGPERVTSRPLPPPTPHSLPWRYCTCTHTHTMQHHAKLTKVSYNLDNNTIAVLLNISISQYKILLYTHTHTHTPGSEDAVLVGSVGDGPVIVVWEASDAVAKMVVSAPQAVHAVRGGEEGHLRGELHPLTKRGIATVGTRNRLCLRELRFFECNFNPEKFLTSTQKNSVCVKGISRAAEWHKYQVHSTFQ